MAHISRKELRKDEVRETLVHGAEAVYTHQKLVAYILGIALIVAIAVFGWRFYSQRQTMKASSVFDDAMKVYNARIRVTGEPEEPGEISYVVEKNKYEDASKKFIEIAQRYPRTQPGQLARYYAGLSLEKLGHDAEAQKWLQELAGSGNDEFAALARLELAQIADRTGKPDEAVKLYQQLIAKPAVLVPKPVAMLALADHWRKTNPAEAAKLYNQIKSEFPDTGIAQQAEQGLELLPSKT
jgi:predicted negative regulator of RcsB-dependent stress response